MVATVIADGSITELLLLAAGIGGTGTTTALVITRNQLEGGRVFGPSSQPKLRLGALIVEVARSKLTSKPLPAFKSLFA